MRINRLLTANWNMSAAGIHIQALEAIDIIQASRESIIFHATLFFWFARSGHRHLETLFIDGTDGQTS